MARAKGRNRRNGRGAQGGGTARRTLLREIAGVGSIALTFAAIISLASYHPDDRSFNALTDAPVRNFLGPFGSHLADLLVQLFGFGAWLFPLFCFATAVLLFAGIATGLGSRAGRVGGLTVFSLSLVGLGHLVFQNTDPFYRAVPGGGALGKVVADLTVPWLSVIGSAILLGFLLVASFTLATRLTPKSIALAAWAGVAALWARIARARDLARGRREKEQARRERDDDEDQDGEEEAEPEGPDDDLDEFPEPTIVHREPPPRRKAAAAPRRAEAAKTAGTYVLPPLDLLDDPPADRAPVSRDEIVANSRVLERKLADFGANGRVTEVHPGPVITMYEFEPAPGVRSSRVASLQDDLALALSAVSVRVVPHLAGKNTIGIELPNRVREVVTLKEVMLAEEFQRAQGKSKLALALGKDIFGNPRAADLGKMPHVLIAGATGSGKSVMINTLISSILFSARPDEVQFLMIDPKMVELTMYDGIPHLIAPVVSHPKKAAYALRNAVGIMEERLKTLSDRKVRDIGSYNHHLAADAKAAGTGEPPALMPYLVIVIDELADLMILAQSEVEDSITRLAQLARAVGIHLVIATQRPSTNVITGIIKANLPVRVSFNVSSKIDSRVILDSNGAEQLLGKGDMLYVPPGTNRLARLHGAFVSEDEVKRLVEYLKGQAQPTYNEAILQPPPASEEEAAEADGEQDEMYDQAVRVVTESGQASISYVQRKLKVGYNRAARMIEAMERAGILGPADGARPRKILVRRTYDEE